MNSSAYMNRLSNHAHIEMRKAVSNDVNKIWSLLHAEGYSWNDEMIEASLPDLFVMTLDREIIAVMHVIIQSSKFAADWIAVHPIYPEKAITIALKNAVAGIRLLGIANNHA